MIPFALASHQRGDLIAPLMPVGAVLAAFPAARWTASWSRRRLLVSVAVAGVAAALGFQFQHSRRELATFRETAGLSTLAAQFLRGGGNRAWDSLDTPYALQFFLGTMHRILSPEAAAQAFAEGRIDHAATADLPALERALGPLAPRLRTVAEWPEGSGLPGIRYRIVTLGPGNAPIETGAGGPFGTLESGSADREFREAREAFGRLTPLARAVCSPAL